MVPKDSERNKIKMVKNCGFLFNSLANYLNCLLPSFSESHEMRVLGVTLLNAGVYY